MRLGSSGAGSRQPGLSRSLRLSHAVTCDEDRLSVGLGSHGSAVQGCDQVEPVPLDDLGDLTRRTVVPVHQDVIAHRVIALADSSHSLPGLERQEQQACRAQDAHHLGDHAINVLVGVVDRRVPREDALEVVIGVLRVCQRHDVDRVSGVVVSRTGDHPWGQVHALDVTAQAGEVGEHASGTAADIQDVTRFWDKGREQIDHRDVDHLFRLCPADPVRIGIRHGVVRSPGQFFLGSGHGTRVCRAKHSHAADLPLAGRCARRCENFWPWFDERMSPHVASVHVSPVHEFSKATVETITLLEGLGVEGDAHCGVTVQHRSRVKDNPSTPNMRQLHLIHDELFDDLRAAGHDVAPGQLGENITTHGLNLLALPVGTRLTMGDAVIVLTGLRNPCQQINDFQAGLLKQVLRRDEDGIVVKLAGAMGIVARGGRVSAGDDIVVHLPPEPHHPLSGI